MTQTIAEPVSVELYSDHRSRRLLPKSILWRGRTHPITQIGLHHTHKEGRDLFHVFSVVSQNLFFRLRLNAQTLFWQVTEISDGLPS